MTQHSAPSTQHSPPLILGIRHHGPGSAKSVVGALKEFRPDVVLVEGPPDAEVVLPLLAHAEMQPPVALLIYSPEEPQKAVYYPFAVFSPEWQAIHYALSNNIQIRFMDLPVANQLAMRETPDQESEPVDEAVSLIHVDPLTALAEASGYSDGERWWEHMVEHRRDTVGLFDAILEAMSELRESVPESVDPLQTQREAHMRQTIRTAQSEGFVRVAVVCGAWHGPALAKMPQAREDAALLKGLPKMKVTATWVPWTYGRLSYWSGYGAGIESPGWYHYLWEAGDKIAVRWMTRIARLLRGEDLDASAAHVIEAVRLAESLAALRDRPLPGLPEMNDAALAIFCQGSDAPMRLIQQKLIISDRLGVVPRETPMVPLQEDLTKEQRRLRLPAEASQRTLDLDLRKPTDLERSHLLHRLDLLGIPWGSTTQVRGKSGTFHEVWQIQWKPEFEVSLIEASSWGNTICEAAASFTMDASDKAADLPSLTYLLNRALYAEISDAVSHLMGRLQTESAISSDIAALMNALPPLADILRYGNVRQTDAGMVAEVVDGLVARVCIGLPGACSGLNDEAAQEMFPRLLAVNSAIGLLQNDEWTTLWHQTMCYLAERQGLHGLLAGRSTRILLDTGYFTPEEAARRMGLALSLANEPPQAAAWAEGFLVGSGLLLVHDDALWRVLDSWVTELHSEPFAEMLPLLRRTFSTFSSPERRQIGERAKRTSACVGTQVVTPVGIDVERAEMVLPIISKVLGLKFKA